MRDGGRGGDNHSGAAFVLNMFLLISFDLGIFRFVTFSQVGALMRLDKDAQTSKSFANCKEILISHNKLV